MAKPSIPEAALNRMIQQTASWCGLNGLMYTDASINWTPAPISLLPNVFPKPAFEYARSIQPILSKLIDRISRDRGFVLEQLSIVSDSDSFTKRLIELYKKVPEESLNNDLQLGILRSDYMVDFDGTPLQVEVNTIASSFGFLSKKMGDFHQFFLERNHDLPELREFVQEVTECADWVLGELKDPSGLPGARVEHNPSATLLAKGIAEAHRAHCFKFPHEVDDTYRSAPRPGVLFIVQPDERNVADQRAFAMQLWDDHKIPAEFITLHQIAETGRIVQAGEEKQARNGGAPAGTLFVRPVASGSEYPVSVAYFRAGYGPGDYPTEAEWEARSIIERANAVKCPSVGYQLAGTKAIQAALCIPGVLERFLSRSDEVNQVRKCFAAQYSLADETEAVAAAALKAVQEAARDGSRWVLKPQREGGGNNLYGKELSAFLHKHQNDPLLRGYVLMQRIFPQTQNTAFFRKGKVDIFPSISELGIYGTFLSTGSDSNINSKRPNKNNGRAVPQTSGMKRKTADGGRGGEGGEVAEEDVDVDEGTVLNEYAGYLLRTKPHGVDEGGVASGFSVINSIILK